MSIEIKDKVVLVTGANRGIGKAIVESLIQEGASKVYLAVRDTKSTDELVNTFGSKVVPLTVDVSNGQSVDSLASQANDVQIVVNNAGVLELAGALDRNTEQSLRNQLEVNTFGLIRMAAAFAPILETNGGGAFVQLNSVASIKNFTDLTTYSASKAAAYSITQGLKDSLAPKGISVLSVHPGPIETDMANDAGFTEGAQSTSFVSEGIIAALKAGEFHLFPDPIAKEFESAYDSYAKNVVEAEAE